MPIQLMAIAQDRFVKWMDKIRAEVPPERQIQAAPEIAGPVLQNLVFLDDSNSLQGMNLNLLKAAIDSAVVNDVHPGFVKVLEHISPTDAILFWYIFTRSIGHRVVCVALPPNSGGKAMIWPMGTSNESVFDPPNCSLVRIRTGMELFESMAMIRIEGRTFHNDDVVRYDCLLTTFGKQFAKICLPDVFGPNSLLDSGPPN